MAKRKGECLSCLKTCIILCKNFCKKCYYAEYFKVNKQKILNQIAKRTSGREEEVKKYKSEYYQKNKHKIKLRRCKVLVK